MDLQRNDLVKLKFTDIKGAITKQLDWVNPKAVREIYGYEVIYFNKVTGEYKTVNLPKTLVEPFKDLP